MDSSGQKDFIMTANFGLPSVGADNRDAYMKAAFQMEGLGTHIEFSQAG